MERPQKNQRPVDWRLFPATKTLGFYDSFAQYIELSNVSSEDLAAAVKQMENEPQRALTCLPLLYHELRHWIDHIATLWGRRRLIAAFNAINARIDGDERMFWRIVEYMRKVDRDSFGRYYRTIEKQQMPLGSSRMWEFQFSFGQRFDFDGCLNPKTPIFFTKFRWSDGAVACRVPFSVSSLLETSAMAMEVGIEDILVARLDKTERLIEERARHERRIDGLYNAELAVYSTAVHAVANRMDILAASDAYPLASALASFCLNLPDCLFNALVMPDEFKGKGDFHLAALKCRDRGYAYLLLLYHADKNAMDDPLNWVQVAATKAGLPSFTEIIDTAKSEFDNLSKLAIDGRHRDRLGRLISVGNALFTTLGISFTLNSIISAFPEIVFPPVLCADLKWHTLGPAITPYDFEEVEQWTFECIELQQQFDEFMLACGR